MILSNLKWQIRQSEGRTVWECDRVDWVEYFALLPWHVSHEIWPQNFLWLPSLNKATQPPHWLSIEFVINSKVKRNCMAEQKLANIYFGFFCGFFFCFVWFLFENSAQGYQTQTPSRQNWMQLKFALKAAEKLLLLTILITECNLQLLVHLYGFVSVWLNSKPRLKPNKEQ